MSMPSVHLPRHNITQICFPAETYETSPCTSTADRVCANCTAPCLEGTWEAVACTNLTNRVCPPCDAGYVCPVGSANRFGTVLLDGSSSPLQCDRDYYEVNGTCVRCPVGSGISYRGGVAVEECVCTSVVRDGSALYTYLNVTEGQCIICPATYYCSVGSLAPVACPPGTFCREGALEAQTCPAGYYCPGGVPDPIPCEAGAFCAMGSRSKSTCTTGFYCPYVTTLELPCVERSYCPTGSGAPVPCPAGSYCPANASAPQGCPAGSYCNASVAEPAPCPANTTSMSAALSVLACFCVENLYGYVFACEACPVGASSAPGTRNRTDCGCDVGFKLDPNASFCMPCEPTEFCPGGNSKNCPAGFVCSMRSSFLCPAGSYCPTNTIFNVTPPQDCPPGAVCIEGSAYYEPCPPGFFCTGNTSVPELCPGGYFCPVSSAEPLPCRGGIQCSPGSPLDNMVCSAGRFCPNLTSTGLLCVGGSSCPAGVSAPITCAGGTYCPEGSAEPTPCPVYYYCPANASDKIPCPPGHVCLAGSASPRPCDNETYADGTVLACAPCPVNATTSGPGAGYFDNCTCVAGSEMNGTECQLCAPGTFKPNADHAACAPCGASDVLGATTCPEQPQEGLSLAVIIGIAAGGAVIVTTAVILIVLAALGQLPAPAIVPAAVPAAATKPGAHAESMFKSIKIK